MSQLFEPGLVYPRDETGPYVELEGRVVAISPLGRVDVEAHKYGVLGGYSRILDMHPERASSWLGGWARIRVYRSGGGFYPDNRIVSWSRVREGGIE